LIDPDPLLEGLDIAQPGKRYTLLLALLRQARMRCRDKLGDAACQPYRSRSRSLCQAVDARKFVQPGITIAQRSRRCVRAHSGCGEHMRKRFGRF
jgi:hypothetical protein